MQKIVDPETIVKRSEFVLKYEKPITQEIFTDFILNNESIKKRGIVSMYGFDEYTYLLKVEDRVTLRLKSYFIGNNKCVALSGEETEELKKRPLSPSSSSERNESKEKRVEAPSSPKKIKFRSSSSDEGRKKIEWRKWQNDLFDQISSSKRSDGRTVIWYYDYQGGTGKTFFCDNIHTQLKNVEIIDTSDFDPNGKILKDKLNVMRTGVVPKAIIFNITGADSKYWVRQTDLYKFLEIYSDSFRPCWFIVFSNTFPVLDFMSINRWVIRRSPLRRCAETGKVIEVNCNLNNNRTGIKRVYKTILTQDDKDDGSYMGLLDNKKMLEVCVEEVENKLSTKKQKKED